MKFGTNTSCSVYGLLPAVRSRFTRPRLLTCWVAFLRHYSHHDYTLPQKYANLLNEYLAWCQRNNNSAGTIDVKRTKIRQFLCFLDGRRIILSNLTTADISDFMTTLCRYHRATIHVCSSALRNFLCYLHESCILEDDLSPSVPRPKIYVDENIPETWTPE